MRTPCPTCGNDTDIVTATLPANTSREHRAGRAYIRTLLGSSLIRVTTTELFDGYVAWAESVGAPVISRWRLGQVARSFHGVQPWRNGQQRGYVLPIKTEGV